ncbi:hypothetical protein HDV00_009073 [Rhizophlyctis rosea]|nr:hypothetical protein HDV00_009073 [Rhizophlyctis rosea]
MRGFPNQASFLLDVGGELIHCKVFHNGSLQIAGALTMSKVTETWEKALRLLEGLEGCKSVELRSTEGGLLLSHDHLVYSSAGEVIGWVNPNNCDLHLSCLVKTEETSEGARMLVSAKYRAGRKKIFNLDGVPIGERRLVFEDGKSRRNFEVKFGYIYCGRAIVGKEETVFFPNSQALLDEAEVYRAPIVHAGRVLRCYRALSGKPAPVCEEGLHIHMVNMSFEAPFEISREKLHSLFLRLGYYCRFPERNPGVNLRYYVPNHTNPARTPTETGICMCPNKALCCSCKVISVRLFNTGKIIVAGLERVSQKWELFEFVKTFYMTHRDVISVKNE